MKSGMILLRHRCVAIIAAILLHLSAILLMTHLTLGGARAQGEQGIEIDLGMLGDLGTAASTTAESAQAASTAENNEPEQQPAVSEPLDTTPEPTPVSPPAEMKQRAELTVKQEKVSTPTEIQQAPLTKDQLPETRLAKAQSDLTETSMDNDITHADAGQKISTGSANSLTSGGHAGPNLTYYSLIAAELAKYKRYPKSSRNAGEEGTVILTFTVLSSGLIRDARIKQSSGYTKLDRSVKKMLKDASPLPAFPADLTQSMLTISIPIVFKLNQ